MSTLEREFNENEADHFGWDGYSGEDALQFARHFHSEVERLRAQFDPLKKTRDGVAMYPGMECWIWLAHDEPAPVTIVDMSETECGVQWDDNTISHCDYDFLYSTREALEACR